MVDAKLLYPPCYAGTRSDTTANSVSVSTVQHGGSHVYGALTEDCADVGTCSSGRWANSVTSNSWGVLLSNRVSEGSAPVWEAGDPHPYTETKRFRHKSKSPSAFCSHFFFGCRPK
jgi:hypothetical protein